MKVLVRKRNPGAEHIPITTPFIKLESFLKLANVVESGGMAKSCQWGTLPDAGKKALPRRYRHL